VAVTRGPVVRGATSEPRLDEGDAGPGAGQTPVDMAALDAHVDHVIADHQVVLGRLERRARDDATWAGFTQPLGASVSQTVARRTWDPKEVHHSEEVLRDRERRARALRELDPGLVRPRLDDPVVTRSGIFFVPPVFEHAAGIDAACDVAIVRAGYRSLRSFLEAPDTDVAEVTGLSLGDVVRAKEDLRLEALPGCDPVAADLLRLAGVHSVSHLARVEPLFLHEEVERLRRRYRFFEVPAALADRAAIERLVAAAGSR